MTPASESGSPDPPFLALLPTGPGRPKRVRNANQLVERGQAVPRLRPVSRTRAFRRVPVLSTHFVWRQAGPLAHRLRLAATAFSLRDALSARVPSGRQVVASSCQIRLASTIRGVQLMRRYCDPRHDFAWDCADRVRVHHRHRRCSPTSAPSTALLGVRFNDIFVNSSALVCRTTADRAGEACRAVYSGLPAGACTEQHAANIPTSR